MPSTSDTPGLFERVQRLMRRQRKLLGSVLIAVCVYFLISALKPETPTTLELVAANTDLPAGHAIQAGDVTTASWPASISHPEVFTNRDLAVGRITTGPLLAGEPIGPSRVIGPGLLDVGLPQEQASQLVAATVRLADPGEVALLKPGDLVDILAARAGGISEETSADQAAGSARVIAEKVRVIVIPDTASGGDSSLFGGPSRSSNGGLDSGSMIVLGVDRPTATALAAAATRSRLSAIVRTD
ncbi:MAG: Flp pilus assembly protein CpaB [Candidatus Nanopelagicales bacterium]